MTTYEALMFVMVGAGAGLFGGLLGLGGGVILVPVLSLWCDVPVKSAIAVSAFAVLINAHMVGLQKQRLAAVNISSALLLQLAALIFSLVGAFISVRIDAAILQQVFGGAAVSISLFMIYLQARKSTAASKTSTSDDPLALPRRPALLGAIGALAGVLAGALGVGGGIFLVPAMQFVGGLPARVATATSSYTMAVTGTGAALVYLNSPHMRLGMTVVCLAGTVVGSLGGNKLAHVIKGRLLNLIFALVLLGVGMRMWLS